MLRVSFINDVTLRVVRGG